MCFTERKIENERREKNYTERIVFVELATHALKKSNEIVIFTYWISHNIAKTGDVTIDDLCL